MDPTSASSRRSVEFNRRASVMATPGKEGQLIEAGAWAGNVIGVFTSGGDSQGPSMTMTMIMRQYPLLAPSVRCPVTVECTFTIIPCIYLCSSGHPRLSTPQPCRLSRAARLNLARRKVSSLSFAHPRSGLSV